MADTRIDELRRRLERDPGSRLFAQLAEELRKGGELAEAIRVARDGLAVHSSYASARLTLGRALLDSGDATSARAELESALRDAPDNILASRYLAQAREQLGDLRGAAEQYRKTRLMAPDDRQLQAALAAVEARLAAPSGDPGLAAETTPPAPRRAPPPLPARAPGGPDAPLTPGRGIAAPPVTATQPSPQRAAAPPVVFAPSRPTEMPEPGAAADFSSEGEELPATLRIHASQTLEAPPPPPAPPAPPAAPMAAPLAAPAPAAPAAAAPEPEAPAVFDAPEVRTLPGSAAPERASDVAPESASTTPFSSSTLAELYFQQGLVDRAVDVYRQLVEQEPGNDKARQRLEELQRAAPVPDERAARRRALERTIAGLETLLAAVRSR